MKKILIIHSNMEIGGAETSLIGLLNSIDYNVYNVDLFLLSPTGELLKDIPKEVNIIEKKEEYVALTLPIKTVFKKGQINIGISRLYAKLVVIYNKMILKNDTTGYMTKQFSHKYSMKFLTLLKKEYDLAISFIDPHYILQKKVNAKVKLGWIHTDFNRINVNKEVDFKMWDDCDYIVSVSDSCKEAFDNKYPKLKDKSVVIENILPLEYVKRQSNIIDVSNELFKKDNVINICSIGRFSNQKNFDNVPSIAKIIIDYGYDIRWYLIGYGSDEQLIKDKIKEAGVEKQVIILGKKNNPYPYIKACDIYVQPSRFEGKAVAVREAQMLNKPVVITRFATSDSQLEDGIDGIIVPMDNEGCAKGIISLIENKELQEKLINNTKCRDYSNKDELEKLYSLCR